MGFRFRGRVWSLGLRVEGLGCRIWVSGLAVSGSGVVFVFFGFRLLARVQEIEGAKVRG